jgi:hypothetical protein
MVAAHKHTYIYFHSIEMGTHTNTHTYLGGSFGDVTLGGGVLLTGMGGGREDVAAGAALEEALRGFTAIFIESPAPVVVDMRDIRAFR